MKLCVTFPLSKQESGCTQGPDSFAYLRGSNDKTWPRDIVLSALLWSHSELKSKQRTKLFQAPRLRAQIILSLAQVISIAELNQSEGRETITKAI